MSSSSEYKFTYFNAKGLGEHIRFIFLVANVSFEDDRIDFEQWAELKYNYKNEQLPILEVDGRYLTQSMAISRFLAKKFKLVARNPYLDAKADEIVEIAIELRLEFRSFMIEREAEKKAEIKDYLTECVFPKYYENMNVMAAETPGNFITGNIPVWQDFFVVNWLEIWDEIVVGPEFIQQFPTLKKLQEAVFSVPAIKNYLLTRPKTFI